jgi:hypothetical protein
VCFHSEGIEIDGRSQIEASTNGSEAESSCSGEHVDDLGSGSTHARFL